MMQYEMLQAVDEKQPPPEAVQPGLGEQIQADQAAHERDGRGDIGVTSTPDHPASIDDHDQRVDRQQRD